MASFLKGDLSLPDFTIPSAPPLGSKTASTAAPKKKKRTLLQKAGSLTKKAGSLTKKAVSPVSMVSDGLSSLNSLLNPKKPSAALPAPAEEGGLMKKIMSPMGLGITAAIFGGVLLLKNRRVHS